MVGAWELCGKEANLLQSHVLPAFVCVQMAKTGRSHLLSLLVPCSNFTRTKWAEIW
jgi:hypothetical protein